VLADGLSLAAEEDPDAIVDLATLTGACVVALGAKIAGLMAMTIAWSRQSKPHRSVPASRPGGSRFPTPIGPTSTPMSQT